MSKRWELRSKWKREGANEGKRMQMEGSGASERAKTSWRLGYRSRASNLFGKNGSKESGKKVKRRKK
jgi:hypothetical protein